ncbi:MAG: hypothetical protein ACREQL_04325 [Candidatus Binatia bacterium]
MADNLLTKTLVIDKPDEVLGGTWRLAPDFFGTAIDVRSRGFKTAADFVLVGHPDVQGDAPWGPKMPGLRPGGIQFTKSSSGEDLGGIDLQGQVCGFPGAGVNLCGGITGARIRLTVSRVWLGLACGGVRYSEKAKANEWVESTGIVVDEFVAHDAWPYGHPAVLHLTNCLGTRIRHVRGWDFGTIKLSYRFDGTTLMDVECDGLNFQPSVNLGAVEWAPTERQNAEVQGRCRFTASIGNRELPRNTIQMTDNCGLFGQSAVVVSQALDAHGEWCQGAGIACGPYRDRVLNPIVNISGWTFRNFSAPIGGAPHPVAALHLSAASKVEPSEEVFSFVNTFVGCEAIYRNL